MARMDSVVDVDDGEDGEDVGLQEGHQKLQRGQRHDHAKRQGGADNVTCLLLRFSEAGEETSSREEAAEKQETREATRTITLQ